MMAQDVIETSMEKRQLLKACGVQFALDDFGAGRSLLSYLKRLPLDQLKLDLFFVRGALTEPDDAIITVAIVALARSLGPGVIAERGETEAQRQFLIKHACPAYRALCSASRWRNSNNSCTSAKCDRTGTGR